MPDRLNINGTQYVRVDLIQQNQQNNNNRRANLTSAVNTIDGQNGITIKIFAGTDNQSRRQRNRNQRSRQGNNNRRAQ